MIAHGTIGGYTNHRCRCTLCRAAKNRYQKALHERYRLQQRCINCGRPGPVVGQVRCERCQSSNTQKTRDRRAAARPGGVCNDTGHDHHQAR